MHAPRPAVLTAGPSGLGNIEIPARWTEKDENGTYRYVFHPLVSSRVVYYLERSDGAVKIGTTCHLRTRRRQLARAYGPLSLIAWEFGSYNLEQRRHSEFSQYRKRDSEWFAPSASLAKHVEALRVVCA